MRGLCHGCFASGVELVSLKNDILCKDCFDKKNAKN
jgi:hypothetical protein